LVRVPKLYYIRLAAPRGPQIPVYGVQTKLALRMITLHEAAGSSGAGIERYVAGLQDADDRIDIVRAVWNDQMANTHRLIDAFSLAQPGSEDASGEVLEGAVS
jgi:hypothetical protein